MVIPKARGFTVGHSGRVHTSAARYSLDGLRPLSATHEIRQPNEPSTHSPEASTVYMRSALMLNPKLCLSA